MPILTSHYELTTLTAANLLQPTSGKALFNEQPQISQQKLVPEFHSAVSELVVTLCQHILQEEPEIMWQIAAGQTEKTVLTGVIKAFIEKEALPFSYKSEQLFQQVYDFLFGYGPLQAWIEDETISDIDGNAPDEFTITRHGKREKTTLAFPDSRSYDAFCRLMIVRNGGVINENDTHCRVADLNKRLRINVTVPPRSVRYATISIRKHKETAYTMQELEALMMLSENQTAILRQAAREPITMLICGKGGSGKTTLLRSFINEMPELERLLIAESDSELFPEKPCCLLQRIKKKHEGGRSVSLRDLIADGLTMSLDSYCIGEIVGDEALELLRAAYSGHRCLATLHAESAEEALDRLLSLAMPAASGESERQMKHMIGKSVNLIVYMRDFKIQKILAVKTFNQESLRYEYATL